MNVVKKLILMKDGIKLEIPKHFIRSFSETSDGLSVQLNDNSVMYLIDQNMPQPTKQLIIMAYNKFLNGDIEVDLNNYDKPFKIMM